MRPLRLLLGPAGGGEAGLLRPQPLKVVVAAGVEVELALADVQDAVHRIVEQLPVVADDDGGVRVFLQPRFQPKGAFQIEVVGGLVQQQHVRLGEQGGGQGHPHTPAAGKLRHRPRQVVVGETQAGEDFGGAGGGAVGVDLDQAGVDFAKVLGVGGLKPAHKVVALHVGGEDGVQQADRGGRMLLVHRGHLGGLGQGDVAAAGDQLALDQLEQGGLADAVAPHQPDLGARRNGHGGLVEEAPAPGGELKLVDLQHGAALAAFTVLAGRGAAAISPRPQKGQRQKLRANAKLALFPIKKEDRHD